jgi:hypothetical protein
MTHIGVAPRENGFQVVALVRPPFEDMFQRIYHPAIFRDEGRAERFAMRVRKSYREFDMRVWGTDQSVIEAYQGAGSPTYCPI